MSAKHTFFDDPDAPEAAEHNAREELKRLLGEINRRNKHISRSNSLPALRTELVKCRLLLTNLYLAWVQFGPHVMTLSGKPTSAESARNYLARRSAPGEGPKR